MENPPPGSTTYELASFGSRFVAAIIDDLILLIASFVIAALLLPFLTDISSLLIGIALNAGYYAWFWTQREGQTPGKRIMNIRVVKADGMPMTVSDALLRVFGYYVSRMTLGLGYLWALFDANNQAWHDKMANTYVVALNPDSVKKTIEI
jgi:uncharacterized RDD family membrane protein YckC